jgi:tripartite-type tricarboxylate transporter receptor subunit TctC
MHHITKTTLLAATAVAAVALGSPARAADLTIVEVAGPGSVLANVAQALKPGLEQTLGGKVTIETMQGDGGGKALAALAKGKPDGSRVVLIELLGRSVAEAVQHAKPALADLTPIAKVTSPLSGALVVPQNSPLKSWDDFASAAKSKRLKLAIAGSQTAFSPGILLYKAQLEHVTGGKFDAVEVENNAAYTTALTSGGADAALMATAVVASFTAPAMRPIATFGAQRSPLYGDTPTINEISKERIALTGALAIYAPAKLPRKKAEALTAAFIAAGKTQAVKEAIATRKLPIEITGPSEVRMNIARDRRITTQLLPLLRQ